MIRKQSTWYFTLNGLARVDISDGTERWTIPTDLFTVFPALPCFGANHHAEAGTVTSAFQTGPNELILEVAAQRWFSTGIRGDRVSTIRVDVATGIVREYPPNSGLAGWRRYRVFDNEAWDILNTVTHQFIARHAWNDSVFTLPGGGTEPLPPEGTTLRIVDGRLYVRPKDSAWAYRIFDLDNLVTDGIIHGADDPNHPAPAGFRRAWSMMTDPDAWLERRPAGEFSRDMLEEINTTALRIGTGVGELLAVMNAESGLRTTAYHPAGRYGLLQLTADQLSAAGWTGTPGDYLAAGIGQLPAIRAHLAGLGLPADMDETGLWLSLLVPQMNLTGLDLDTVVAAPGGPRPELFGTHGVADVDGDGRLTVGDLHRYLRGKRGDGRLAELQERTSRFGAIIPAWQTLTEVNEGDEMGIVRPSAAQLGLTVHVVALQQEPGFDHEQVVSIDPPAETLVQLTRPIQVTVNFSG